MAPKNDFLHIMRKGVFADSFGQLLIKTDKRRHAILLTACGYPAEGVANNSNGSNEVSFTPKTWFPNTLSGVVKYALAIAQSRQVIVHGFFHVAGFPFIVDSSLAGRSCWVAWGRDIHSVVSAGNEIESKVNFAKKTFNTIAAVVPYDFEHAVLRYQTIADYAVSCYPNPIPRDAILPCEPVLGELRIMIGHSASRELNHVPILKALHQSKIAEKNKIICPLSYGDRIYANQVLKLGESLFDNFEAVLDFMTPTEYGRLLSSIDVAVLHTNTQIAFGNLYALLYAGVTVYINKDNVRLWQPFINQHQFHVLDSNRLLEGDGLKMLTSAQMQENRKAASKFFDSSWVSAHWLSLFGKLERNLNG